MSGGVDSSVVACLLKRQGFEVTGVFLKLCDLPNFKASEKQARKIAKILKIHFYVFDLQKEFKKKIINYFLQGYKKGITPNPCVLCNKEIKIDEMFRELKRRKIDFDFLATGHYAKIQNYKISNSALGYSNVILSPQAKNPVDKAIPRDSSLRFAPFRMTADAEILKLFKGKDVDKDQSYFLWMLKQKELKKILFPLGDYTKIEVKKMAKKFKLPISKFHDSQEACFIQDKKINDFLSRHIKAKAGDIVNIKNKIIGRHQGLMLHTIGQRTGIGLSGGPYYVMDKNIKKNILIVTKNQKDLFKKELFVKNINWIASSFAPSFAKAMAGKGDRSPASASASAKATVDKKASEGCLRLTVKAKIRYHHEPANAVLKYQAKTKKYKLTFSKPQKAITSGQSVVFYKNNELLGGGIIDY